MDLGRRLQSEMWRKEVWRRKLVQNTVTFQIQQPDKCHVKGQMENYEKTRTGFLDNEGLNAFAKT